MAKFARSGLVKVATAGTSVMVSVNGGLSSTSYALAMLQVQSTPTGTLAVQAVFPNPSTGKLTIYFTGTAPVNTEVAWFVFG